MGGYELDLEVVGVTGHVCPLSVGELLALYAVCTVRGNTTLAAKLLTHARIHESEPQA